MLNFNRFFLVGIYVEICYTTYKMVTSNYTTIYVFKCSRNVVVDFTGSCVFVWRKIRVIYK